MQIPLNLYNTNFNIIIKQEKISSLKPTVNLTSKSWIVSSRNPNALTPCLIAFPFIHRHSYSRGWWYVATRGHCLSQQSSLGGNSLVPYSQTLIFLLAEGKGGSGQLTLSGLFRFPKIIGVVVVVQYKLSIVVLPRYQNHSRLSQY